uniref:Uncharacterized protein n=1 Tax=Photinus pyralis TaxID=7054 RepID=A0A1Y1M8Y5_PHOPY
MGLTTLPQGHFAQFLEAIKEFKANLIEKMEAMNKNLKRNVLTQCKNELNTKMDSQNVELKVTRTEILAEMEKHGIEIRQEILSISGGWTRKWSVPLLKRKWRRINHRK